MIGEKASGIFGSGLPLYDDTTIVGALCGDHNIAWRVRKALGLDKVPAGITAANNDAITYDISMLGKSSSGFAIG
jgi:hypothetical protein